MNRFIPFVLLLLAASPALACEAVRVGDIEVANAWSRASIGVDRPGVVYLTIKNLGTVDDALLGIATPAAGMPMLHETVMTDGVAAMPHVMSVPVGAGATVALAPGGMHAMLMGLTAPLEPGATFPVTLTFQTAGELTVAVDILAFGAQESGCSD